MQEFSFNFHDPVFEIDGWRLSAQVISFENTYGLPHDATAILVTQLGSGADMSAVEPPAAWRQVRHDNPRVGSWPHIC